VFKGIKNEVELFKGRLCPLAHVALKHDMPGLSMFECELLSTSPS